MTYKKTVYVVVYFDEKGHERHEVFHSGPGDIEGAHEFAQETSGILVPCVGTYTQTELDESRVRKYKTACYSHIYDMMRMYVRLRIMESKELRNMVTILYKEYELYA